jgi:hypothetical protein
MWDDGVAPELCLDFEVQHWSRAKGLMWWLGGLGFFAGLYQVVKWTDPASKNPALPRKATLPVTAFDPVELFNGKRDRLAAAQSGDAEESEEAEH